MMAKKQAEKACKAHGFDKAVAARLVKWQAGGAASNAWLERYKASLPKRDVVAELPSNQEPSQS